MWATGLRKVPNLTANDIAACIPIGLFACLAHCGSVLASAVGAVSFAQIVKACEPVFAAAVGLLIPPMDVKPVLAYVMLVPIVGGVGIACVKEGKGVDINVQAFLYASMANAAAALKGKLGSSVTKTLKGDPSKNMDAANVYAVMNIISFFCSIPFVVVQELPTLAGEWNKAVEKHGLQDLLANIVLSGFMFYIYNEFGECSTSFPGIVQASSFLQPIYLNRKHLHLQAMWEPLPPLFSTLQNVLLSLWQRQLFFWSQWNATLSSGLPLPFLVLLRTLSLRKRKPHPKQPRLLRQIR